MGQNHVDARKKSDPDLIEVFRKQIFQWLNVFIDPGQADKRVYTEYECIHRQSSRHHGRNSAAVSISLTMIGKNDTGWETSSGKEY